MEVFEEYLTCITDISHQERMKEILEWVNGTFPELAPKIAWNQPMFTSHGTFIIGFSMAKQHMSIAPEAKGIQNFSEKIKQAGYSHSKELMRIPWNSSVNFPLLKEIIEFNIADKAECSNFWRK